jgi:hypothetical protein
MMDTHMVEVMSVIASIYTLDLGWLKMTKATTGEPMMAVA